MFEKLAADGKLSHRKVTENESSIFRKVLSLQANVEKAKRNEVVAMFLS